MIHCMPDHLPETESGPALLVAVHSSTAGCSQALWSSGVSTGCCRLLASCQLVDELLCWPLLLMGDDGSSAGPAPLTLWILLSLPSLPPLEECLPSKWRRPLNR